MSDQTTIKQINKIIKEATKECNKCFEVKPVKDFYDKKAHCKLCDNKMCREYKAKNRAKISTYNKQYKSEHKEEISVYNHNYNLEHLEEIQPRQTRTRQERKAKDPNFKKACDLRSKLTNLVSNLNDTNRFNFMGCSNAFLKKWLEFQFNDKMTFANYGTYWHVDHVIPCSKFNFENEEDIKYCFQWSNIQPLEGIENQKKTNKIDVDMIINHEAKIEFFIGNLVEPTDKYTIHKYDKTKYIN
jgi:hypothetical protein